MFLPYCSLPQVYRFFTVNPIVPFNPVYSALLPKVPALFGIPFLVDLVVITELLPFSEQSSLLFSLVSDYVSILRAIGILYLVSRVAESVPAPSPLPSATPSSLPSSSPSALTYAQPSPLPSGIPSSLPSSMPTQTSMHSLLPTQLPTQLPSTEDTVSVAVSFSMIASSEPTANDNEELKEITANALNVDIVYLKGFNIISQPTARRWFRRGLLASYTWVVTFTLVISLQDSGSESASTLLNMVATSLTSDEFASTISSNIGATLDTTSVVVVVSSTRYTPQPTLSPTLELANNIEKSNTDMVVLSSILGLSVILIASTVYYCRSRAKKDSIIHPDTNTRAKKDSTIHPETAERIVVHEQDKTFSPLITPST